MKQPSAHDRFRELTEIRGMDPDTADALTSGEGPRPAEFDATREHFGSGFWFESLAEGAFNVDGSIAAYPDDEPRQFRWRLGWWRAGSGQTRAQLGSDEAHAGYDAFVARYPERMNVTRDFWDDEEAVEAERRRRYPKWK